MTAPPRRAFSHFEKTDCKGTTFFLYMQARVQFFMEKVRFFQIYGQNLWINGKIVVPLSPNYQNVGL